MSFINNLNREIYFNNYLLKLSNGQYYARSTVAALKKKDRIYQFQSVGYLFNLPV